MPPSSPLNIYALSSWARSTLIPILLVDHHQPIYALPNGLSPDNDFLDELWVDPSDKNVPYAPPLSSLFWQRDYIKFGFTAIDSVIANLGNELRNIKPLRDVSRKKCVEWLLEHQEEAGEVGRFLPADAWQHMGPDPRRVFPRLQSRASRSRCAGASGYGRLNRRENCRNSVTCVGYGA